MASAFRNLLGIVGNTFQIGKGRARLRTLTSAIAEVRNSADSAYAILRGASPVGVDDYATKNYVDTADAAPSVDYISAMRMGRYGNRFAGGGQDAQLGGGDYTTGQWFRPLREMTITGARFVSLSLGTPPYDVLTYELQLWDADTNLAVAGASGTHTTTPSEDQIVTVNFGTPKVITAADVNRPFAVSMYENSGVLFALSSIQPFSTPAGVNLPGLVLSPAIMLIGADFYAPGPGSVFPGANYGGGFIFLVEPVFTIP